MAGETPVPLETKQHHASDPHTLCLCLHRLHGHVYQTCNPSSFFRPRTRYMVSCGVLDPYPSFLQFVVAVLWICFRAVQVFLGVWKKDVKEDISAQGLRRIQYACFPETHEALPEASTHVFLKHETTGKKSVRICLIRTTCFPETWPTRDNAGMQPGLFVAFCRDAARINPMHLPY